MTSVSTRVRAWYQNRQRSSQIAASLPEAIDLMVVVMQAGLDFQTALEEYLCRAPSGALREALAGLQAEMKAGIPRLQALRNLRARTSEPSFQETLMTLIQGLELGSSLSPLLKAQARALRLQRAAQAEKRAAVAPLKLLFPLFVFIFPTLFVVLFGPVALTVLKGKMP